MSEEPMVECNDCGFKYHRQHFEPGKPCPVCEVAQVEKERNKSRAEIKRLRKVIEHQETLLKEKSAHQKSLMDITKGLQGTSIVDNVLTECGWVQLDRCCDTCEAAEAAKGGD